MKVDFLAGQVVTLKAGSHDMTVKDEREEGVCCTWFNPGLDANPLEHVFPPQSLKLKDGEPSLPVAPQCFRGGQAVRLRSGGPKMTLVLTTERPSELLQCIWFDERMKYPMEYLFRIETLVEV